MKAIITALTNTYKAVRLLGDPTVSAYLESQLKKEVLPTSSLQTRKAKTFGTRNAFYHKHYIVQVLN